MARTTKNKRSRFDGISLDTLNKDVAKVTGKTSNSKNETSIKKEEKVEKLTEKVNKRGKGRPKSSTRKPLNTAIEPKNRQRLEFLAMLNGGSVADQLNDILERYFTEIEKVDELIDLFEERKRKK
jgi:hypothetical protein